MYFSESDYLTSKLAQLNASGVTQYKTTAQVKAAIEAAGFTTQQHFEAFGADERTSPNQYFNANEYLAAKAAQLNKQGNVTTWTADTVAAAIKSAGMSVYSHFEKYGWYEGVNPSNSFSVSAYLATKATQSGLTVDAVKAAFKAGNLSPVSHFMTYGVNETGVTVTPVPAAEQVTPSPVQVPGQTFTLTTGVDNFNLTSGNDTVTGAAGTLGADLIIDASTTDNDTLTVANTDGSTDTSAATIVNIENVTVNETSFGTATVNAGGIKSGTLTVNQLQAGANGDATVNGTVGSITVKGGTGVTGTLTVNAITAGSTVVVDAGSAATVITSTAGAKGSMTIKGGASTATATAIAETINVTVSKEGATVNIDGDGDATADTATVTVGKTANLVAGAANAVETINISATEASTVTVTGTNVATTTNITGSKDLTLSSNTTTFDGKTVTDASTAVSTVKLTTLTTSGTAYNLSKVAVDKIDVAATSGGIATLEFNDKATVSLSADVNAAGLVIDANDNVATTYLKGTLNLSLDADDIDGGSVTIDGSGATDDGFDTVNLTVNKAQDATGLNLITGTAAVIATGSAELKLATTSTMKSLDASAMTGAVTVVYDNTDDIATVTTGSGADTISSTAAIGTKATISTGAGNDNITMLTAAKAAIDGGLGYDKVTLVGDITALEMSNVEELATSGAVTSAKASQISGKSYIMSGANTFTFGTAASNFDTSTIDLSSLTINNLSGFTVDVSNGLSTSAYTSNTAVTVTGSSIADTIKGTANGDTLNGGAGNDVITGNDGSDTINGGAGTDVIYADNGGVKRVETYDVTTAGAGNALITILGTTLTVAYNTDAATTESDIVTAINGSAALKNLVSAAIDTGVVKVTYLVDGNNAGSATTSTATLVINTTGTNSTAVSGTQVTAGTAGTSAMDTLTGGADTDTFVFSNGNAGAAPSDTKFDTITDFATNSDVITFATNTLTIVQNATATSGVAKVTAAGIATFHADDSTLAKKITAVEAAIQTGTQAAGQMAVFQDGADAYAFISDGTDGVGAGDVLVKLVGVDTTNTSFDTVTISGHSFVLA